MEAVLKNLKIFSENKFKNLSNNQNFQIELQNNHRTRLISRYFLLSSPFGRQENVRSKKRKCGITSKWGEKMKLVPRHGDYVSHDFRLQ